MVIMGDENGEGLLMVIMGDENVRFSHSHKEWHPSHNNGHFTHLFDFEPQLAFALFTTALGHLKR
jgi:hypothetical protein